jgi:hypothetical protein
LRRLGRRTAVATSLAGALLALVEARALAASFVITNADGAGEGFNDPTSFTPVGGNNAMTLGAARLAVFQSAGALWGAKLTSAVPIRVTATFDPLSCSATSATLGAAGSTGVFRDFPAAPRPATWYPAALADALAGSDLDPGSSDIVAYFNSTLDLGTCLGGASWYYGLDGHPPAGKLDLLTVLLHELAHGLGFLSFVDVASGAKLMGYDDVFSSKLARLGVSPSSYPAMTDPQRLAANTADPNLVWVGPIVDGAAPGILTAGLTAGDVRLYAPATLAPGSSVSHYSTALSPNEIMEPSYSGPDHDLTLTLALLRDLGWPAATPAVDAASPGARWLLAWALLVVGHRAQLRGRQARRAATSATAASA